MNLKILVLILLLIGLSCCEEYFEWVSTPGDLRSCSGDDVILTWEHNSSTPIATLFWSYGTSNQSSAVTTYYKGRALTREYDPFKGRTEVLSYTQEKSSIKLKGIQKSESGNFILELAGPAHAKSVVKLEVFEKSDEEFQMTINSKNASLGSKFEVNDELVVIESNMYANIIITTNDELVLECLWTKECRVPKELKGSEYNISVDVSCAPFSGIVMLRNTNGALLSDAQYQSQRKVSRGAVAFSVIAGILVVPLAIWIMLFILKRKDPKELSDIEENILDNFSMLDPRQRKRRSEKKVASDEELGSLMETNEEKYFDASEKDLLAPDNISENSYKSALEVPSDVIHTNKADETIVREDDNSRATPSYLKQGNQGSNTEPKPVKNEDIMPKTINNDDQIPMPNKDKTAKPVANEDKIAKPVANEDKIAKPIANEDKMATPIANEEKEPKPVDNEVIKVRPISEKSNAKNKLGNKEDKPEAGEGENVEAHYVSDGKDANRMKNTDSRDDKNTDDIPKLRELDKEESGISTDSKEGESKDTGQAIDDTHIPSKEQWKDHDINSANAHFTNSNQKPSYKEQKSMPDQENGDTSDKEETALDLEKSINRDSTTLSPDLEQGIENDNKALSPAEGVQSEGSTEDKEHSNFGGRDLEISDRNQNPSSPAESKKHIEGASSLIYDNKIQREDDENALADKQSVPPPNKEKASSGSETLEQGENESEADDDSQNPPVGNAGTGLTQDNESQKTATSTTESEKRSIGSVSGEHSESESEHNA